MIKLLYKPLGLLVSMLAGGSSDDSGSGDPAQLRIRT